MLKVLVAVDGSEPSLRAVRYAVALAAEARSSELELLNVQPPLPAAVTDWVSAQDVRSFHVDTGIAALREAKVILDAAAIPYNSHVAVGPIAETIADHAEERGCDQIVMGRRGLHPLPGILLGSVTIQILHLAKIPAIAVK